MWSDLPHSADNSRVKSRQSPYFPTPLQRRPRIWNGRDECALSDSNLCHRNLPYRYPEGRGRNQSAGIMTFGIGERVVYGKGRCDGFLFPVAPRRTRVGCGVRHRRAQPPHQSRNAGMGVRAAGTHHRRLNRLGARGEVRGGASWHHLCVVVYCIRISASHAGVAAQRRTS